MILNREVDSETAMLIGKNEGVADSSVYTEIVIAHRLQRGGARAAEGEAEEEDEDNPDDGQVELSLRPEGDSRERSSSRRPSTTEESWTGRSSTVPTKAKPDEATIAKLLAAWELVRRVPSNGIVIADGKYSEEHLTHFWTLGVASFRKRNGAVKIALDNAGARAAGAVCASDGFFPFRDNIDLLGRAGVKAIIQPGGSLNDAATVAAADEYGIAMAVTHTRAFKH